MLAPIYDEVNLNAISMNHWVQSIDVAQRKTIETKQRQRSRKCAAAKREEIYCAFRNRGDCNST